MEIESHNADKFYLKPDAPILIGRDYGIHADDRTVSRRHVSLQLHSSNLKSDLGTKLSVSFEAVGKNPVWVRNGSSGEIRVFRKGERGELGSGDAFSISGKKHVWFRLRSDVGGRLEDENLGDTSDSEFEGVDVRDIDPVKEFGFVIMGHEFDSYSKHLIHDIKKWNWFLEDPKKGSDDDDDDAAGQMNKGRGRRRKGKKSKHDDQMADDDDEWEGESEEDKEVISKTEKVPRPTYSARSKDCGKLTKFRTKVNGKSHSQESRNASEEEMGNGDDNENDETLGGFIVDNEEELEDDADKEDEEEEEFEEDDADKEDEEEEEFEDDDDDED